MAGPARRVARRLRGRLGREVPDAGGRDRSRLGGTLAALLTLVVAGGAAGLALGLRAHPAPPGGPAAAASSITPAPATPAPASPAPGPSKPPVAAAPSPPPWRAPSTIAYVSPGSVSFPTGVDGWVLGEACDAEQDCETGVARTADGGATWAMSTSPVDPNPANVEISGIAAASAADAWVWGTTAGGQGVFAATHDGGESWQPVDLGGVSVLDLSIAEGTAWALTGCSPDAGPCDLGVSSSPVGGGPWTELAALPAAVRVAAVGATLGGPSLVRSGARGWVVNSHQASPVLGRTVDGGASWSVMPVPCAPGASASPGASSAGDLMLACSWEGAWPAPQEVWTSADGGAHWLLRSRDNASGWSPPASDVGSLDNPGAPEGLAVLSASTAWMVSDRGPILVTHDGGATWTPPQLPPALADVWQGGGVIEVTFVDAARGWLASQMGLWATSDGGADWAYQPILGAVPGF